MIFGGWYRQNADLGFSPCKSYINNPVRIVDEYDKNIWRKTFLNI